MTLLSGMNQLERLPALRQQRFERFYRCQTRFRVLPLFADLSLAITFIGTLLFLLGLSLAPNGPGISGSHLLYTAVLAGLIIAHRHTRLRRASPAIVYLVFLHMALFSYLAYILAGATLAPIVGLLFFISSVGIVTLSLAHTVIILLINFVMLAAATALAVPAEAFSAALFAILANWLVLMCLLVAPCPRSFSAYSFATCWPYSSS